jgi:hypothetical protein
MNKGLTQTQTHAPITIDGAAVHDYWNARVVIAWGKDFPEPCWSLVPAGRRFMEEIFIAYGFTDPNRLLVREIDTLCYSQGVRLIAGEILGGAGLSPAIRQRIQERDALIALATRDKPLAEPDTWQTHQWVRDEFGEAVAHVMPAIALVETGVQWEGMHREHERIDLDREHSSDALLRLASTAHRRLAGITDRARERRARRAGTGPP